MSGPISAPGAIHMMSQDLKKVANNIDNEMTLLNQQLQMLRSSGVQGPAMDMLILAGQGWDKGGREEVFRTANVAAKSVQYKENIDIADARARARFDPSA